MRKVLGLVIFISIFGCKSDSETQILELSKKSQEFASNEKFEEAAKLRDYMLKKSIKRIK